MTNEPTQDATAPEAPAAVQEAPDEWATRVTDVAAVLDKLQQTVQATTEQRETDTKTILSTLQRLEASLTHMQTQIVSGQPLLQLW